MITRSILHTTKANTRRESFTQLTQADAERLRGLILAAAHINEATPGKLLPEGQMYVLDFPAQGLRGTVIIRTAWIVEQGKGFSAPGHLLREKEAKMSDKIQLLDVVALLEDVPSENLKRGEVGTVVELFAGNSESPESLLVEFSDRDGEAYAFASLRPDQLVKLRYGTRAREAA